MSNSSLEQEFLSCLEKLGPQQQQELLALAKSLSSTSHAASGANLLQFAGGIEPADLEAMSRAIEEGCEQVDRNGW